MNKKNIYLEALRIGLNPTGYLVQKGVEALIQKGQDIKETGSIDQLEEEVHKQELYTQMSEAQAKISQELAIAQRIQSADEVEIEEFYEYEGTGSLGVSAADSKFNIGAAGHGKRVTKRIYKFKGWNANALDIIQQQIDEQDFEKE